MKLEEAKKAEVKNLNESYLVDDLEVDVSRPDDSKLSEMEYYWDRSERDFTTNKMFRLPHMDSKI